ncbi:MAG: acetate--CoA ligase [Ardenticatenaceae bacterium]|nr:acetate--CoA ligase [Ardenticatenaceae bacterium]
MEWQPILKDTAMFVGDLLPNIIDYEAKRASFFWDEIAQELDGLPHHAGLNIAHEAVDRHANSAHGGRVAMRWLGRDGSTREFTYQDLKAQTNRVANVLRRLGINREDTVFALSGRIPELYFMALGTWKNTSIFCPLFSAFGPEPILQRMKRGQARVLFTTERLFRKKVAPFRDQMPHLEHVILADGREHAPDNVWSMSLLMADASPEFEIPPTHPEDKAIIHFTSGTTGMPKGAVHVHQAIYHHYMTSKYALDIHPEDVFWCTADPGWVTGTSYGIIAPLLHGVTNIIDEAEFDAERWYRILAEQKVTVWYTAPTAVRRLMRLDLEPRQMFDLSHLRFVASVGEPLNPEAVVWGEEKLGLPIHDNWWQTETGGIMIANLAACEIRPGSMGRPLPGVEAAIVRRTGDNTLEIIEKPGVDGELALKPGWPSMFRTYLHEEARYNKCFVDDWYLSGDLAMKDEDGYFWFVGRADDIIKTAGHMVGPFEVESALMEHPAVAEVGVIGVPEPTIGELVKAFVALKPGNEPTKALRRELLGFGRKRLGSAVAPKEIVFKENLPKTRSGKIMRRLLKARELGLPEGDTSTLEEN